MIATPLTPDSAQFFTTDPQRGALRDANGDGVADGLRVRLLLLNLPTTDEWLALLDLAARLGLETGGLALPLAVSSPEELPDDAALLAFLPTGSDAVLPAGTHWLLRGAAEVRALCRADLPAATTTDAGASSVVPTDTPFDLARFYEVGGALAAADDGPLPAWIRLCPIMPPDLPPVVGLALLDLAARLGLESTGVRFPLGVAAGEAVPVDAVPFTLAISAPEEAMAHGAGHGSCGFVQAANDSVELRVSGDADGVAATIRALAACWPHLDRWAADAPTIGDLAESVTSTLLGADTRGRAAILTAGLEASAALDDVRAGELRILVDEPPLMAAATTWSARRTGLTVTAAPDDRLAFVEEWTGEWEVDRARRIFSQQIVPALAPASPAALTILVSEPRAIREALAAELAALLPPGSTVHVLSAFKVGLCWLTEIVAPHWQGRDELARIVLTFRPFESRGDQRFLDLPIRPLQELYPGDELLATALGLPLAAITLEADPTLAAEYRAIAFDTADQPLDTIEFSARRYNREYLTGLPDEGLVTVATGAIVARQGGRTIYDERLPTDIDLLWDRYQGVVLPRLRTAIEEATGGAITPDRQPFFAALAIDAWVSETDQAIGVREELLSSAEALHQDFYFGTLDAIAALGGSPPTSGTLDDSKGGGVLDAPGAIRPFVHVRPGAGPRLRVALRRRLRHLAELVTADGRLPLGLLPTGGRPRLIVRSFQGRAGQDRPTAVRLELVDPDTTQVATLRSLATQTIPDAGPSVEVVVGTEVFALTVPLVQAPAAPSASAVLALPAESLDNDELGAYLAQLATLPDVVVRTIGRSYEGRPLAAIELHGAASGVIWSRRKASLHRPTVLIIARHHANEPASTHAALLLAERWATDPAYRAIRDRVNIAVLPLENPDGAALHAAMRREHPTWKHHVARYNAVGREFARDYFDPETPWGEARARPRLWHEWLPDLVIDNHGVPSHEWNQHFNGFGSPPRFGVSYWLVSALLYGILRYPTDDPAHAAFAEAARERVAVAVGADPALAAGNAAARAVYERWGHRWLPDRFPATYHREMLWYFGPQATPRLNPHRPAYYDRITVADIVTEVPDETAQGDYLALVAHAHLVANEALLALLADNAPPIERHVVATPTGIWLRLARPRPMRL